MPQYPICKKLRLLRCSRSEQQVISSNALYEVLGNDCYQRACQRFHYRLGVGPLPESIEAFLKEDPEAQKKVQAFLNELLDKAAKRRRKS